jgi:hypothetical protein
MANCQHLCEGIEFCGAQREQSLLQSLLLPRLKTASVVAAFKTPIAAVLLESHVTSKKLMKKMLQQLTRRWVRRLTINCDSPSSAVPRSSLSLSPSSFSVSASVDYDRVPVVPRPATPLTTTLFPSSSWVAAATSAAVGLVASV